MSNIEAATRRQTPTSIVLELSCSAHSADLTQSSIFYGNDREHIWLSLQKRTETRAIALLQRSWSEISRLFRPTVL